MKLWTNWQIEDLTKYGCEWLNDYLITHPQKLEELKLCQTDERKELAASSWKREGDKLASKGEVEEAVAAFKKALKWNQELDIKPKVRAESFDVDALLSKGYNLVREGKVEEAIASYQKAKKIDDTQIYASHWDVLCWYGSLYKKAADVMLACEKAVSLSPKDGDIIDSRGLARALTGDIERAIADFQVFVEWTSNEERKAQRQEWIKALQAGENPFTDELLKELR